MVKTSFSGHVRAAMNKCIHKIKFRMYGPKDPDSPWGFNLIAIDMSWDELSEAQRNNALVGNKHLNKLLMQCSDLCTPK